MCLCVGHDRELCKNGRTDQDALQVIVSHLGPRNYVLDESTYERHMANMLESFLLVFVPYSHAYLIIEFILYMYFHLILS